MRLNGLRHAPGFRYLSVACRGSPSLASNLPHSTLLHDAHNFWPQFPTQPTHVAAKNLRFNQTSLAIEAAVAGQGMALASRFFVQAEIDAGRLVQALPQVLQVDASFYILSPRKPRQRALLIRVRDWLVDQASAD